jgi:hypothetical protein
MATTFKWAVGQLRTVQQPDPNYVVTAVWTVFGQDGQCSGAYTGSTEFDSQQSSAFIPYNQLTQEIVLGWVQTALGEQGIAEAQANVQAQIDYQKGLNVGPQVTPLPWSN